MCPKRLPSVQPWRLREREELILRSDMAYELGGDGKAAVSGIAFTTDTDLISENGVFLIGRDLPDISEDTPYARFTFLCLDPQRCLREESEQSKQNAQALYGLLRKMEYTRYHIFPEGYMMRISSVKEREPVRISRRTLDEGMDFSGIGACFEDAYRQHSQVLFVQTYFITAPHADYRTLGETARRFEEITESMNSIFHGLSMDCSTCAQKTVCDEIDGMRELHLEMADVIRRKGAQ